MVEGNDPKAEPLEQIASLEDGDEEFTYAECGVTGVLKAHTRKVKKVPPPPTPERLRKTYKVLENSFLYAMRKHGNVWWLQDFAVGTFATLADYVLGKKVMRLEAASDTNTSVPWSTLLKYEYQVRKEGHGAHPRGQADLEAGAREGDERHRGSLPLLHDPLVVSEARYQTDRRRHKANQDNHNNIRQKEGITRAAKETKAAGSPSRSRQVKWARQSRLAALSAAARRRTTG